MTDAEIPEVVPTDHDQPQDDVEEQLESISEPAKVMRIGAMIKQLLEEVRQAPLDEAGRERLAQVYDTSIRELSAALSPDLREELDRLTDPFEQGDIPTEAELRIAQAQLVGWLEGLFHGIQTALFAQQMSAKAAYEEMRRRAITGSAPGPGEAQQPGGGREGGPYL